MSNDIRDDVFDAVIASAFSEYMDREAEDMPSRKELEEEYPAPKNGLRRLRREIKKRRPRSTVSVCLRRVAAVLLASAVLLAGAMTFSTEVRSAVFGAIIQWFDKFASLSFGDEPEMPVKVIENVSDFEIGYVPSGMELASSEEEHDFLRYMYTSSDSEYLQISIHSNDSTEYAGDIELSEYDSIMINDINGYIFYNPDERLGSVFFEKSNYSVMISCILEKSELIKVAESIK